MEIINATGSQKGKLLLFKHQFLYWIGRLTDYEKQHAKLLRSLHRRLIQNKMVPTNFKDNRPYELEGLNSMQLRKNRKESMSEESESLDSSLLLSEDDMDYDVRDGSTIKKF